MYRLFPVHALLTINMLACAWTLQLIVRATFYTGPHKQVCNAYGHGTLCALHPSPALLSRSCSSHGHKCQVLHTQVPGNTGWRLHNHHCVCLKVPWKPFYILCHHIGFSHTKMYFKTCLPKSCLATCLLLLAIVISYLLASTPCALCICSSLQLCSPDVRKHLRHSGFMSLLSHVCFSIFDPWFFKYLY